MKILAIDLGKRRSVTCDYDTATGGSAFGKVATTPAALHDLLAEEAPDRLVIEIGSQAGWVHDLAAALEIEIQVANTSDEKWKWNRRKRKTDRDDALKLARLSALKMLATVHMPEAKTRQWRSLIAYRQTLVGRVTAVKNHIRAILDREGRTMPAGRSGWTEDAMTALVKQARPLKEAAAEELWRGMLDQEIGQLDDAVAALDSVEAKLDELAGADERVRRLRTIPGVGPRLSETVVAIIDDPHRFANTGQVGCYAGLTPRQFQSGERDRQGRISGAGSKLLRTLLVEVSWLARRYNPWLAEVFERVCRGSRSRRKIAIVACARRLLIRAWAMLRDGTDWKAPPLAAPAAAA